ncbi:hypothetical protein SPRG_10666 [Saprolegnia parasitica CBS 223.65]|uniref:Mitochondrial import inner membrane translocase subunit TIM50 n=1 Tax=Saprolegnia parasitica (strain CBS 223.65) TaxID=695850 RepID=A0A067BZJ6_SAPPC|nr:hypothetical protein SPRG_10666 [Saprolegnia parasitica CBS 223.65]KDO23969.1 hypothetical protein SPRG_10666 [Saprolegnia parasitica CBS 223.65]|eukprot:XP_012205290.1 hypothetical protein SPRG_10666 [Saprolegnia parasitica CBS 223.65]
MDTLVDLVERIWATVLAVCCYLPPEELPMLDETPLARRLDCPRLIMMVDDHPLRVNTGDGVTGVDHVRSVLESLHMGVGADEVAVTRDGDQWLATVRATLGALLAQGGDASGHRAVCERVYTSLRRRLKARDIALRGLWRVWLEKEFRCLFAGLRLKHASAKKCLVLDLDRTLWFRSFEPIPNVDFVAVLRMTYSKLQTTIYVSLRPGVHYLLQTLAVYYDLVVFTASEKKFTDLLIDEMDTKGNIQYRLYRDACSLHEERGHLIKDLTQLGRDMKDVILIDDTAEVAAKHPANALICSEYRGSKTDIELYKITMALERLAYVEDVRSHLKHLPSILRTMDVANPVA